ncbi:MAG: hypothetical protein CUN56_05085 [Phototrophicales bacterium]|nr:MAG: hypothetical protein CUN56_05085 [Phototrophicales bacterium]
MKRLSWVVLFTLGCLWTSMAVAQTAINPGDVIEDTANGEAVLYTFSATAGMNYLIKLESDDFDPLVEILNSDEDVIASDDDSGGFFNALLSFTAPTDGIYTIVVTSWSGSPAGVYTLSLSELALIPLVYDDVRTVELNGAEAMFFGFDGVEGEFVTITADSADDALDTELALFSPNGEEIAFDDDGGPSLEPAIVSVRLPMTGVYQVVLSPGISGTELNGTVDVLVTPVDGLLLDDGQQITLTLGEAFDYQMVYFTAQSGTQYQLSLISSSESGSPTATVNDGTFGKRLNADGFTSVSGVFTAETDGIVAIRVEQYLSFQPAEIIVSLIEAE